MNTRHTLAGLGLTMGAAVAFASTALADSATPEPISAQVTKATSASRQTSSEVTVEGTWQTPHLTPGSVLTVGTGATLDGIKVALAALALGVFLAACVYVSNRCGLGGEGR